MHSRSVVLALVAAVTLLAGRATAEPAGNYTWVTPMAGWVQQSNVRAYPLALPSRDGAIFGARVGHEFGEFWGFEAAGAMAPTKEDGGAARKTTYVGWSLNGQYTPVRWHFGAPYFEAGWGFTSLSAQSFKRVNYMTFEQAAGWNGWFDDRTGYRLEVRNVLNMPRHNLGSSTKADQQYWLGLTWAWGGKPLDSDGDGVRDKKDKCPSTPTGATVDVTGCPKDTDGDGVWDGIDKCPDTPKGATVDATGCPKDTDGDGVWDGIDKCPDTPKGAIVDATGCPKDGDGDGVWDGIDQCPGTPAGVVVDAKGCPVDSDADGVPDGLDKCPNTPTGAKVDTDGCPIEVTEKETEMLDTGMIRLNNVNFETAKSNLLPEALPVLDQIGPILLKWPQLQLEVGGHTDSRGGAAKNLALSQARADAVRAYLLQKFPGIAPEQLGAKGYGATKPLVPNSNAVNMAKNRRVEFVVLNKDVLKKEVERRKLLQK